MSEVFRISGKSVKLSGRDVDASDQWNFELRPGGWIIASRKTLSGQVERRRIAVTERFGKLGFSIDGTLFHGEIQKKRATTGADSAGTDEDLVARFPGKVRKVLVREGDQVAEGDPLVMVEAMKMEFPVKAPFAGVVGKIHVQDGQQLSPGSRFLDLEAGGQP